VRREGRIADPNRPTDPSSWPTGGKTELARSLAEFSSMMNRPW
jgi:hypothetical protein